VSAVFNGHIHSYIEDNVDGMPVYISGGSGAKLEKPSDRNHYPACTVELGGTFHVRRQNVEDARNSDYPEYAHRADFPNKTAILFASAGFLVGGVPGRRNNPHATHCFKWPRQAALFLTTAA